MPDRALDCNMKYHTPTPAPSLAASPVSVPVWLNPAAINSAAM